jgi:PAS domain S-box-containing protein
VVDITGRKRAEEALRQSENKYRKIFENIQDVFYQTDIHGKIVEISPSIERYSETRREEFIGQPVETFYSNKEDRASFLKFLHEKGEVNDYEIRLKTKTGRLVYVSVNAHVMLDAKGKPAGIEGSLRDITERHNLEAELRQSQKMEGIGQLAGGVAHDFNNILASTLMQVELLGSEENLPVAVKAGLEQIHADTKRAANLTRQLLLFSRRQVMQPRILNLNEQVISLVKMLQRIIGEDVNLELHLHPSPLLTYADAGMLDQVLMNLVVNSRDAMPEGGRLRIETAEKTIAADEPLPHPEAFAGHFVCLTVSDTGSGIPPGVLPRIFEPFFTTKTEGKGTGLGLATVYGIVKQHRGWIQLDNRPGQGATFHILLPASAAAPETASSDTKFRARHGTETILLVEDEPGLLTLTRKTLERFGYHVLTATNGLEALKLWQEQRATVALLLTDLVMPGGLSGQELARQLQEEQPQIKVVYTSGYSAEIAGREFQLRPSEAFVQKPVAPNELLKFIREILDR